MKLMVLGAAAMLSLGAAPAPPPAATPSDAAGFAWLGGTWFTEEEIGWTEERWSAPRGGAMLGTSLSGRLDRARNYEFMRLVAGRDGKVGFEAWPNGKGPVRFALVSASGRSAVFENPANDYPSRIEYRREGDVLVATITGAAGRNPQTWRYRRIGD